MFESIQFTADKDRPNCNPVMLSVVQSPKNVTG